MATPRKRPRESADRYALLRPCCEAAHNHGYGVVPGMLASPPAPAAVCVGASSGAGGSGDVGREAPEPE